MRRWYSILLVAVLATTCPDLFAEADLGPADPIISCGNGVPGGINCIPTKQDLKEAHKSYAQGLKLEKAQRLEEAFARFDEASRLAPRDLQIFSAREMVKSQLVFQHTQRGDALLANARQQPAIAEFRSALKLDPDNPYMQQRLQDALRAPANSSTAIAGLAPNPAL